MVKGSAAPAEKRKRLRTDNRRLFPRPNVRAARTLMQEIHSAFIPAEFEQAANRQSRRVLPPVVTGMRRAQHFCPGRAAFPPASLSPARSQQASGKYYSNAASRTVPVRRLPLCAHIPRSAERRAGASLHLFHALDCDSNCWWAQTSRSRACPPFSQPA